jgi:3D (Asp-Asp-Asp) domain-containing protein
MQIYRRSFVSDGKKLLIILFGLALLLGLASALAKGEEIKAKDGKITSLPLIQGNSLLASVSPTELEEKMVKKINVVATAYSSSVWETDDTPFLTAAGTQTRDGVIANNILPFGTKIKIPELYGDKIFVVEDRMNWKKGDYQIDIWFPSYGEAKEFGAKNTYIEILES